MIGENVIRVGEKRNVCRIFEGRTEGKRLIGRLRSTRVDSRQDGVLWTGIMKLRIGTSGRLL
jgi:hypothetical protein